jgi:hypothetical protein
MDKIVILMRVKPKNILLAEILKGQILVKLLNVLINGYPKVNLACINM